MTRLTVINRTVWTMAVCGIMLWPLSGGASLLQNNFSDEPALRGSVSTGVFPDRTSAIAVPGVADGLLLAGKGGGNGGNGGGNGGNGTNGGNGGRGHGDGTGAAPGDGTGFGNGPGKGIHEPATGNSPGNKIRIHEPGTGLSG